MHPSCCAGHACDYCSLCLSGTCCAGSCSTTTGAPTSAVPAVTGNLSDLQAAVALDAARPKVLAAAFAVDRAITAMKQTMTTPSISGPVSTVTEPLALPDGETQMIDRLLMNAVRHAS